jgi:LysR family transcriptional regulator, cyn operon transcriptional activator
MSLQVNFRHLRTFVAIAEAGGIARAGGRLNLSQPAASRQILALEADLGVQLFGRIGCRFRLTSEGEDLLRQCRRLLTDVDSLTERARALKTGQTGILRVGATPQTIESLLVDFLTSYGRRHPGVEVHLVEEGGVRLPSRLERGDVHLIIIAGVENRFHYRLLFPVYMLAVLAESHRLSCRAVIDVAELADEPLLRLGHGFASRDWFDAACQIAQIRPHVLLESAAPQTLIALAAAGKGIALVPSTVLISRGNVRAVPLVHRRTPIGRWGNIAWYPQRFLARYAEQFIEELAMHVTRDYPGREFTRRAPPLPRPNEPAKQSARSNLA